MAILRIRVEELLIARGVEAGENRDGADDLSKGKQQFLWRGELRRRLPGLNNLRVLAGRRNGGKLHLMRARLDLPGRLRLRRVYQGRNEQG